MFNLKLNESLIQDYMVITRVPGGWIYTQYQYAATKAGAITSCFVPYSNDLKG